jgi:RNA polymerase sigma factor (TIGR02999 family)
MPEARGDVTVLLSQLRAGKKDAADQLVPLIYDELRRIAGAQMKRERSGHTLQATAVVNEAYMRLAGEQEIQWQNRAHFFAIAARVMRQVLLDYARQRHAGKRGGEGARKVDIDAELIVEDGRLEDVIAIDELLGRLNEIDPQHARIAELRYFAGLNVDETAEAMGTSATTVKREWRLAKAWLHRELTARSRDDGKPLAAG